MISKYNYTLLLEEMLFCGALENLLYHLKNPLNKDLIFSIELDNINSTKIIFKGQFDDDSTREVVLYSLINWTPIINKK